MRTVVTSAVLGLTLLAVGSPAALGAESLGVAPGSVGVDVVRRVGDHLEVTMTFSNFGTVAAPGPGSNNALRIAVGCPRVAVLNRDAGRLGGLRGDTGSCESGRIVAGVVEPGHAYRVTAQVDDPGGSTVDVLWENFQPVLSVPVQGPAATAEGGRRLLPRSVTVSARTREGAMRTTGGKQVALDSDVLFPFGSATLSAKANAEIARAVQRLQQQPGRRLGVYGHTDGVGSPSSNLTLSRQRAEAVRAALAARLGPGWTFEVQGFGETRPVAAEKGPGGDNPDGRALNRRVELQILS